MQYSSRSHGIRKCLTVNRQHGRFTDPPRGDVLSDARVIPLMPQLCLSQYQVSIAGLYEVAGPCHVVRYAVGHGGSRCRAGDRLERRAVLQPVDLRLGHPQWRGAAEFRVPSSLHGQRVRRRQEVLLQVCARGPPGEGRW